MKNITVLLVLASLLISSCKPKDPCEDVDCVNGVCESGNCLCETGYEGIFCETEQRLAFVGDYDVSESCDLGDFSYMVSVNADSEVGTELTIHNIGDFDFDVTATVDGTSISIDDQTVNGATVNGTGTLANGVITVDYTLTTTGGQTLACTMTCTPQ